MMAFYIGVSLLVALNLPSDNSPPGLRDLLLLVWGVTVGLVVTHWFALSLSVYLVRDPSLHHTSAQMLFSQLVVAVAWAGVASGSLLVTPSSARLVVTRMVLALGISVLVTVEARAGGRSLRQGLGLGAVALLLAEVVATLKYVLK